MTYMLRHVRKQLKADNRVLIQCGGSTDASHQLRHAGTCLCRAFKKSRNSLSAPVQPQSTHAHFLFLLWLWVAATTNMERTDTASCSKRKNKTVSVEFVEENCETEGKTEVVSSSEQTAEQDAPSESTDKQQEKKDEDEQDSQMDAVIEVKGSAPTVTVSWEKNEEEGEGDESKTRTNGSNQMTMKEMTGSVNKKRRSHSNVETSPSKKPKLINDGFCLFVGNLNNSKPSEEVRDSLANYFMTQSLLVQDIRLDGSKKYAYVDLASEMDLTKALTLNGEMILAKPMKIAKAKVKSEDKVKVPALDKKAKDARCLFLKNVPYDATKKDILKIFHKAITIRFPGGAQGPNKGIAFVEFKNKTIARKVKQKKQGVKLKGRVLIVDFVGKTEATDSSQVRKTNSDNSSIKAAVPPNNTLFVSNLSYNVTEKKLKRVFQKAVKINMPQNRDKSRGFAFVEFATVADATKALQSSQNIKMGKRTVGVHFCKTRVKPENAKVQSKTLFVMGLAEKTTAETLKSAFEEATSTRVAVDKDTGVSKRFGFVDFENEETCKAVKEAMEDCEIDGSKVTVAYAKTKSERGCQGASGDLVRCPSGKSAGRGAGQRGNRGSAGKHSRAGGGRGAGTMQGAVEEVENKD